MLGVDQDHFALEHVEVLVGTKDGAKLGRVAIRALRSYAEDEAVDLVSRGVDPIVDLAGLSIAPDMARHANTRNQRRAVEGGAGRGAVFRHALPGS